MNTPQEVTLNVGHDLKFYLVPLDNAIISYHWYEIQGSQYLPVGENLPVLTIPQVQSDDLGRSFFCRIITPKGPYWSKIARIVPLRTDLNKDHRIDNLDFNIISSQWLSDGSATPSANIVNDLHANCVDQEDLAILIQEWTLLEQAGVPQLLAGFDTYELNGKLDGMPLDGIMGGVWDTHAEETGNCVVELRDGSQVLRFMSLSTGEGRGIAFNNIDNPIENNERGMLFFRFLIRADSQTPRSFFGLHDRTGSNPLTSTNPLDTIVAGFGVLEENENRFSITSINGTDTFKSGLLRDQWYDCWIVVDNSADLFGVYLSEAESLGSPPSMPRDQDSIAKERGFDLKTNNPITGAAFICPAGDIQSSRTYIDDIYWGGK